MDCSAGKGLLKTFNELEINLGKVGTNVVEAWFDTGCTQITDFLNWLSNSISEQNVLCAFEIEEFEENKKNESNFEEKYRNMTENITENISEILDLEENEFDIECLTDEIDALLEDEQRLDRILYLYENHDEEEISTLTQLEKQLVNSATILENAEEHCLKLGCELDEINNKLHGQIRKCSEKYLEYNYPSSATFISNISLEKYNHHYKDILSYFGLFEKREVGAASELKSAVKTCQKISGSIFQNKNDNKLNDNFSRLFKSIQNKNYKEAIKMQLQSELKYLQKFNPYDLINSFRSKYQLEMNVNGKSDYYGILTLELENVARKVSERQINLPAKSKSKQQIKLLQGNLKSIQEFDNVFTGILSYYTLLYFMLSINNAEILKSGEFFRYVHHYIGHNLRNCELRMGSMTNIIKQYELQQETPLEQTNKLIKLLIDLSKTNTVSRTDFDLLNNFENERQLVEKQLFLEQSFHREHTRMIENQNKLLKTFLTNGPTSEFIILPFKLYRLFREIDENLDTQKNVVTKAMEIWMEALKKISENEWFKYKRRLWMYYLIQPQKVLTCIQKIEKEIKKS